MTVALFDTSLLSNLDRFILFSRTTSIIDKRHLFACHNASKHFINNTTYAMHNKSYFFPGMAKIWVPDLTLEIWTLIMKTCDVELTVTHSWPAMFLANSSHVRTSCGVTFNLGCLFVGFVFTSLSSLLIYLYLKSIVLSEVQCALPLFIAYLQILCLLTY